MSKEHFLQSSTIHIEAITTAANSAEQVIQQSEGLRGVRAHYQITHAKNHLTYSAQIYETREEAEAALPEVKAVCPDFATGLWITLIRDGQEYRCRGSNVIHKHGETDVFVANS